MHGHFWVTLKLFHFRSQGVAEWKPRIKWLQRWLGKKLNVARGSRENKDVGGVPVEFGSPTIRTWNGFRKCIIYSHASRAKGLNNAGILAFFVNEFTYMKMSHLVHCIKGYMDCFSYMRVWVKIVMFGPLQYYNSSVVSTISTKIYV